MPTLNIPQATVMSVTSQVPLDLIAQYTISTWQPSASSTYASELTYSSPASSGGCCSVGSTCVLSISCVNSKTEVQHLSRPAILDTTHTYYRTHDLPGLTSPTSVAWLTVQARAAMDTGSKTTSSAAGRATGSQQPSGPPQTYHSVTISGGGIAGIVIGVIVLLILIVLLVKWWRDSKKNKGP